MSTAVVNLVAVACVCGSGLAAWVLWLRHARWLQVNRNAARDESIAKFESRIDELERAAKSWRK